MDTQVNKTEPRGSGDEITLKELILKIQEYWAEIWRYKWWVVLVSGLFAAGFLVKAWLTKPTYTATLTFMVNEDEGGSMGGVAAILGQFGFGGGVQGQYNLDKIVQLAKSRRIIQEVLFDSLIINGKSDYIANHVIDLYEYDKKWENDTLLESFKFNREEIESFSRGEGKALQAIYGKLVGDMDKKTKGLATLDFNEESGILILSVSSLQEDLSIKTARKIYEELSKFYVDKTTEKQRQTFDNLTFKTDSIQKKLYATENQLAKFKDASQNLMLQQNNVEEQRLSRQLQVLTILYGEALKNRETADFLLKNATPFFQIIDEPVAPLRPIRRSKLIAIILGGFLGAFIVGLFLTGKIFYRTVMR